MLKQRFFTAMILIAIFLSLYRYTSSIWFARLMALVTLMAAFEWAGLSGFAEVYQKILYVFFIFSMMIVSLFVPIKMIVMAGCLFWIGVFIYLLSIFNQTTYTLNRFVRAGLGVGVFIPTWVSVSTIRLEMDFISGLSLFIIVAIADSAAYFSGRWLGKHLMAPNISPKKTWEGLLGALFGVVLFSAGMSLWHQQSIGLFAKIAVFFGGLAVVSAIGDLFESAMKRIAGVKDSGTLLRGHGGILDRIDGICAAAPFFALLIYW